jgi:short-subunit dehydrogenase
MSESEITRGTKTYRRTAYPAIDATQPSLSTKGKSAVVTGAGQGIGASIAHSLARSGLDYLALMGRRPGPLASVQSSLAEIAPGCKVFTYTVDIADEQAVKKGFADFVADMVGQRPVDVLIANAGYMADLGSLDSVDVDNWWTGFEINGIWLPSPHDSFTNSSTQSRETSSSCAHI